MFRWMRIRCSKIEENKFRRRDLAISDGICLIGSPMIFTENANAADLIQRRQRSAFQTSVKGTLFTAFKVCIELKCSAVQEVHSLTMQLQMSDADALVDLMMKLRFLTYKGT